MYKSEAFKAVLSIVSKETEIPSEQILSSCKTSEVVDARYILVNLLCLAGLYPSTISSMTGMTRRSVNVILTNFESRKSSRKMFGINYENIKKQLGKGFSDNSL